MAAKILPYTCTHGLAPSHSVSLDSLALFPFGPGDEVVSQARLSHMLVWPSRLGTRLLIVLWSQRVALQDEPPDAKHALNIICVLSKFHHTSITKASIVLWSLTLQDEPPDAKHGSWGVNGWSQDLFISPVKGEWSRSEHCS